MTLTTVVGSGRRRYILFGGLYTLLLGGAFFLLSLDCFSTTFYDNCGRCAQDRDIYV